MTSSNTLFKLITDFVKELNVTFGNQQKSLKLYERLISKTLPKHTTPIKKHIESFKKFCIDNRNAITNKDKLLITEKIQYSLTVFIDIKSILDIADIDTSKIIWQHLLTISAFVDPSGKAKEILKSNIQKNGGGKNETDFLTNIINKVDEHVSPNSNPMEAISSIMKSGVFTELIGGMNDGLTNGTLDIGKLMGTVQSMMGTIGTIGNETNGGDNNPMNMINIMMSNLMNKKGEQTSGGDISNIMSNLMTGTSVGVTASVNINLSDNTGQISSAPLTELSCPKGGSGGNLVGAEIDLNQIELIE